MEEVWGNLSTLILFWFGFGYVPGAGIHMNMIIGGASETTMMAFAWALLGAKGKCWQRA